MNTARQAGQNTRDLAQKIARRMAEEPIEVLKDAEGQVTGVEIQRSQENSSQDRNPEDQAKMIQRQNELQDKARSGRRIEALNQEIRDIQKQDLFGELQSKIAQGLEIPVADFPELSMDQKQVLKAQMEAYQNQKSNIKNQNVLTVPVSKRGRRFGQGQNRR